VQYVELGAVRVAIGSGKIVLQPNPRTASTALDLRSAAQVKAWTPCAQDLRGTASAGVLQLLDRRPRAASAPASPS